MRRRSRERASSVRPRGSFLQSWQTGLPTRATSVDPQAHALVEVAALSFFTFSPARYLHWSEQYIRRRPVVLTYPKGLSQGSWAQTPDTGPVSHLSGSYLARALAQEHSLHSAR
jgi:hypothetical protein